ncbi:MAG: PhoX family phosphatase [Planctomycetota bacterium]|jgi:secreted PhoX family phosphatase|nr:PhoX family phosphatase [Planctomycetota bacterium]
MDREDQLIRRSHGEPFVALAHRHLRRRDVLRLGVGSLATGALAWAAPRGSARPDGFEPLAWRADDRVAVPPGYEVDVVVRWGDPLSAAAPAFDPAGPSAAAQALQFGYNCDFVGFLPLPRNGFASDRGLLCVSSEYTSPHMMWPEYRADADQVAADLAAHGLNVVEVVRQPEGWRYVPDSALNRRVTGDTPVTIAGPAAGHALMRTSYDPSGTTVRGTLNNCSGGLTPWRTWLQAEENFNQYFTADPKATGVAAEMARRYGIGRGRPDYPAHHPRFDLSQEPNEANCFGWMVELDPYDPTAKPIKRTALGRFKHEAASLRLTDEGRVAVYMGDDQGFEYVYKFVSEGRFNPELGAANGDLLNEGVLYVARYTADGGGEWLPLVFGHGPLTAENGFGSQAEVLIRTREAADLLGATPMDRPEDVEASPLTGRIYIACTNNTRRAPAQAGGPNPRGPNRYGHIIELEEAAGDAGATTFRWTLLLTAGPPGQSDYNGHADASPLSCPDNLAFDRQGNLWITTDGQTKTVAANDGVYRVPLKGDQRGNPKQFLSGVPGGEISGPCFTPDQTTFFCAIQHPGVDVRGASWQTPGSRFPDYDPAVPPRPSVIAVRRTDGGQVGE